MEITPDGNFLFTDKRNPDNVLVPLDERSTKCSCRFWKAYHFQCSHLFLLHNGFSKPLCSKRWFKFKELETLLGPMEIDSADEHLQPFHLQNLRFGIRDNHDQANMAMDNDQDDPVALENLSLDKVENIDEVKMAAAAVSESNSEDTLALTAILGI